MEPPYPSISQGQQGYWQWHREVNERGEDMLLRAEGKRKGEESRDGMGFLADLGNLKKSPCCCSHNMVEKGR